MERKGKLSLRFFSHPLLRFNSHRIWGGFFWFCGVPSPLPVTKVDFLKALQRTRPSVSWDDIKHHVEWTDRGIVYGPKSTSSVPGSRFLTVPSGTTEGFPSESLNTKCEFRAW